MRIYKTTTENHLELKGHEYEQGVDSQGFSRCKSCQKIASAKSQRDVRIRVREQLNAVRLERGCAKCGYNKHAAALQFDHIVPMPAGRRTKRTKLPENWASLKRFLGDKNIQVLCANCHCIKTRENEDYKVRHWA